MKKILMVCLGNICRSPLAEGILRKKVKEYNLSILIDSAGTSNYHIGQQPDKRTQENARKHGIDLSNLRGRQFSTEDFNKFDYIYCMDKSNLSDVLLLARTEQENKKVDLLLNASMPNSNRLVPDPYFGGAEGFENAYQLIDTACESIVKKMKNE